MQPWNPAFPVGQFKEAILGPMKANIGYTHHNYDIAMDYSLQSDSDLFEVGKSLGFPPQAMVATNPAFINALVQHLNSKLSFPIQNDIERLKKQYLNTGKLVCLTIGYPGHAVAYLLFGTTAYVFNTQKSESFIESNTINMIHFLLNSLFFLEENKDKNEEEKMGFTFVDVLEHFDEDDSFQTDDDNYCVIWMLFILEMSAKFFEARKTCKPEEVVDFLDSVCEKAGDCLELINQQYRRYRGLTGSLASQLAETLAPHPNLVGVGAGGAAAGGVAAPAPAPPAPGGAAGGAGGSENEEMKGGGKRRRRRKQRKTKRRAPKRHRKSKRRV